MKKQIKYKMKKKNKRQNKMQNCKKSKVNNYKLPNHKKIKSKWQIVIHKH